jgi:hypothetical protein
LADLRVGNKKRQAFEGGFISEEGIKVSFLLGCREDVSVEPGMNG